jgi:hypothetical protein
VAGSFEGLDVAEQLSRRKTIVALAAAAACALTNRSSASAESAGPTENCTGPTFSATGPNADLYGANDGYPLPDVMEARRRRGAIPGSPSIGSARSPIWIKSIQHGSSSGP